jgi:AcrR family transcriptional regulator
VPEATKPAAAGGAIGVDHGKRGPHDAANEPSIPRVFRRVGSPSAKAKAESSAGKPESWSLRRDEVIAAASRLMSEGGYRAISMDRLAEELQVSKPTVYYYVDNKAGLWSALAELAEGRSAHLRDVCSSIDDPLQLLKALIHESVTISTGEMRWTSALMDRDNFPDDIDPAIADRLLASAQSWFHTVIAVVQSAIEARVLPDLNPVLTALNFIALGAWSSKWYKRDYDADPVEIERSILGLILGTDHAGSAGGRADGRTGRRNAKNKGRTGSPSKSRS